MSKENLKKYRITKGSNGGNNANTISIEFTRSVESANFVARVRTKAVQLFGTGLSLDTIGTTYGVHFRFADEKKNRAMAKMLIKVVELEDELLKLKNT
jgi:hypothetical protein